MHVAGRPSTPPRGIYTESAGRPGTARAEAALGKALELLELAPPAPAAAEEDAERPSTAADAAYLRWRQSLNMHLGIGEEALALPPLPRTPHPRSPRRTPEMPLQTSMIVRDVGAGRSVEGGGEDTKQGDRDAPGLMPHPAVETARLGRTDADSWVSFLNSRRAQEAEAPPRAQIARAPPNFGIDSGFSAPRAKPPLPPPHNIPPVSIHHQLNMPPALSQTNTVHTNQPAPAALRAAIVPAESLDGKCGTHKEVQRSGRPTDKGGASLDITIDPDIQSAYDALFAETRREIMLERSSSPRSADLEEQSSALVLSPQKEPRDENDNEKSEEEGQIDDTHLQIAFSALDNLREQREALVTGNLLLKDSPSRSQRRHRLRPRPASRNGLHPMGNARRGKQRYAVEGDDDDVENLAENIRSWRIPSPNKRAKRNIRPTDTGTRVRTSRIVSGSSSLSSSSSTLTIRQQPTRPNGLKWFAEAAKPSKIRGGILDLSL